jgi:hypothetical protein
MCTSSVDDVRLRPRRRRKRKRKRVVLGSQGPGVTSVPIPRSRTRCAARAFDAAWLSVAAALQSRAHPDGLRV